MIYSLCAPAANSRSGKLRCGKDPRAQWRSFMDIFQKCFDFDLDKQAMEKGYIPISSRLMGSREPRLSLMVAN